MSIGNVLSGFVKGYEVASEDQLRQAGIAKTRAETKKLIPATEGDIAGRDDPLAGGGGAIYEGTGGTDSTTTGSVGGDTNQIASRLKADLMKDFKISDVAAGGIVASLAAETGGFTKMQEISPTVKGSRGGYGYAQWTGPRRLEFEQYAKDNNLDINSYEANYGNLKRELQGPEGAILKDLANAKDYHDATRIFTGSAKEGRGFLRPGDVNMAGRFGWADKVAGVKPFSGTQETGEAGTDVASDNLAPITETSSSVEEANEPSDAIARKEKRKAKTDIASAAGIDMSAPQVADAGPIYEDETAFAARGGVIPEPKQRRKKFAEGGTTNDFGGWGTLLSNNTATGGATDGNTSTAADYNTGFGNATFTEENAPVAGWFDASDTTHTDQGAAPVDSVLTTQTNTQQAATPAEDPYNPLRDTTQDVVTETPVADTTGAIPENPAAPTTGYYDLGTGAAAAPSIVTQPVAAAPVAAAAPTNLGPYGGLTMAEWGKKHGYGTYNPSTGLFEKNTGGGGHRGEWGHARGGMVFAQGGAIPDPAAPVRKYAGGGSVFGDYWTAAPAKATNRDERFQQLLKIESRGMGSQQGGSSARDRAARRLAAEEGRPSSTAYKPGQGGKKAPGKKIGTGPKTDPITTKSTPEIADPHTNVTPGPKPEIADPHTNVKRGPTPEIADPHTNVKPTAPKKKSALEEGFEDRAPKAKDRITDLDKPVIPEPDDLGPAPPAQPGVPGPSTPGYELDPGRKVELAKPDPARERVGGEGTIIGAAAGALPDAPPGSVVGNLQAGLRENDPTPPTPDALTAANIAAGKTAAPPAITPPIKPPVATPAVTRQPGPPPAATPAVTPAVTAAPGPPPAVSPAHAKLLRAAVTGLANGTAPSAIATLLRNAGVPQELWPPELNEAGDVNAAEGANDALAKSLGFAPGGAIPEPGQPGYNEAVASGETAEPERLQATPRLRNDVATALDSGVHMLKKVFNLGGEGAVPTPEDGAMRAQGARRMASGEGAATPQEIQAIDQRIDPDNRLDEASKAMTRLAKTTQWYLEQGRPEDAAASAMSLMQAGAQKFGRIGSMAKAAYNEYQKSHDPQDLQATVKFLEKAYEQIPDGANIEISINPDTQMLQVAKTNADGEQEMHDISAAELPGLIQQAQSGSYYWQEIFKLADPKGYENKLITERQVAEDKRTDERWDYQHGVTSKEDREKEERTAARTAEEKKAEREQKLEDEKRANKEADRRALQQEALLRGRPGEGDKPSDTEQTAARLKQVMGSVAEAKAAFEANPDDPAAKQARDQAYSRAYEASNFNSDWMIKNGMDPEEFDYVPEGPAQPKQAPDGSWWVLLPNGKYGEVEAPAEAKEAVPVS